MDVIELPDHSEGELPEGPKVKIHAEIVAKINFAYHQSAFPVLTDLSIENLDEENRVEGLLVELTSNPGFIKPKAWRVDRLAEGGRIRVQGRDLELDADFLLNLSEAVRGTVTITVWRDEECLTSAPMGQIRLIA